MVKGVADLRKQLDSVPRYIQDAVKVQLEKEARKLVAGMRGLNPMPDTIKIDWTWGDVPAGALKIGQVKERKYSTISIQVYATATTEEYPDGFAAVASWFEFGTAERVRENGGRTGKITPSPYFFPVYRANRRNIRSNLSRAITRAAKKANA